MLTSAPTVAPYTEIQVALPRELGKAEREELAREATRELLGDRFAYTLAVHVPLAKDNIDQPHMHLMFSERAVDESTRGLAEDRFFKRNGAKKDPAWNDRNKPEEVRERWVEMMNGAMQKAGIEQRLDARSWEGQGREDLASLREEKTLRGDGPEAIERHETIDEQRRQRAELPAPHLDRAAAILSVEQAAEKQIGQVREREAQELSRIDRLIAVAKEFAAEVKDRTAALARTVADRVESFFGTGSRRAGQRSQPLGRSRNNNRPTLPHPRPATLSSTGNLPASTSGLRLRHPSTRSSPISISAWTPKPRRRRRRSKVASRVLRLRSSGSPRKNRRLKTSTSTV